MLKKCNASALSLLLLGLSRPLLLLSFFKPVLPLLKMLLLLPRWPQPRSDLPHHSTWDNTYSVSTGYDPLFLRVDASMQAMQVNVVKDFVEQGDNQGKLSPVK
ncbi:Hypothetical protein P9303_19671 [Prochlorococcus marinus str. MIT 9303]|uniref:Uncharacterized protein n=1 Tax=Prochlorococcus marinus (strain MIT 9303) TaxID=59922 RepID=A2CB49_PROM3|nr:Hypothetical protein P9303_19671 [Prochlorococcus marinus str. MIT 9303]